VPCGQCGRSFRHGEPRDARLELRAEGCEDGAFFQRGMCPADNAAAVAQCGRRCEFPGVGEAQGAADLACAAVERGAKDGAADVVRGAFDRVDDLAGGDEAAAADFRAVGEAAGEFEAAAGGRVESQKTRDADGGGDVGVGVSATVNRPVRGEGKSFV